MKMEGYQQRDLTNRMRREKRARTRGTLMNKSEEWGKADTTYFRYERLE